MVVLSKSCANTVRYDINTRVATDGFTATFQLGDITKKTSVSHRNGSFDVSAAELADLREDYYLANVVVADGSGKAVQSLHVQVKVVTRNRNYRNVISVVIVEECRNADGSGYGGNVEGYLHAGTFYLTRRGAGTASSPYVYENPVVPKRDRLYIDLPNGVWYRWNYTAATPSYVAFSSGGASVQSDLGVTDESAPDFVKGKRTSNLVNDGEDGMHPFVDTADTADFMATICLDEDWGSGRHYEVGDTVVHDGMWYECVTENDDSEFDVDKWAFISIRRNLGVVGRADGKTLKIGLGIVNPDEHGA